MLFHFSIAFTPMHTCQQYEYDIRNHRQALTLKMKFNQTTSVYLFTISFPSCFCIAVPSERSGKEF